VKPAEKQQAASQPKVQEKPQEKAQEKPQTEKQPASNENRPVSSVLKD